MNDYRLVILGGGIAAGYAAGELVERGVAKGDLALISAEPVVPYERPPLSKEFLIEEDRSFSEIEIHPPDFYQEHGIDLHLHTEIVEADLTGSRLVSAEGREFRFDKLLIATGTSALKPAVPGSELGNVLTLRTVDDCRSLKDRAKRSGRAVVVGGGFIAMEAAAALSTLGVETTLVNGRSRLMEKWFTAELSRFFEDYLNTVGVRIESGTQPLAFSGTDSEVVVELDSGRRIPSEFVLAGVGVRVNTEFLGSQVPGSTSEGLVVNEYLQTPVPNVFAAGDLARFHDLLGGGWRRIEHWDNAVRQGRHAARVMTGLNRPYLEVSYFFSDILEHSYEYWGDPSESDVSVVRGNLQDGSASVWWLRQGTVTAALVMNRPDVERRLAPLWVRQRREVSAEALADPGTDLAILEAQDPTLYDGVLDEDRV